MEKDCYKDIIEEVSKKLAEKVCSEEKGLAGRATMIDQDVQDLVQEIGLKAEPGLTGRKLFLPSLPLQFFKS